MTPKVEDDHKSVCQRVQTRKISVLEVAWLGEVKASTGMHPSDCKKQRVMLRTPDVRYNRLRTEETTMCPCEP